MASHDEKKEKLVLKIAANTWENASRDVRELSVVRELGANVIVMAKGERTGEWETVRDFPVYRMSTRPLGRWAPNFLNRVVSVFTWARQAARFKPDVISGHDLIPLFIGWLSSCFRKKEHRPKLVYDSHEFTIYAGRKGPIETFLVTHLERFLIKRCAFVIEVNDLIADEVQKIHKLKDRPVVVRNIPEKWDVDPAVCQDTRERIMASFGGGKELFLLMYHGGVMPGRGIEMLIQIVFRNTNVAAIILGNGDNLYVKSLKEKVKELSLENRICFHEAVPQKELWKYVGAVDVGMILAPAISRNHLYSLPNKLFENIQSETPVICPAYPAMKKIVEQYGSGLYCDPTEISELNHCIERLRTNQKLYKRCKENAKIAKDFLCWEREKEKVKDAYEGVI